MTPQDTMRLALEALEYLCKPIADGWDAGEQKEKRDAAIEALRSALAQQDQDESDSLTIAYLTWYYKGKKDALAQQWEPDEMQKQLSDALNSAEFYKRRVDALQKWQSKMRDPERTIVCDIIANGCTLEPEGDRYTAAPAPQPAVSGLQSVTMG